MNNVIINTIYIILSIITFFGLIFLTDLSFNTKIIKSGGSGNHDVVAPQNMNSTKLTISQITVVLVWLQILFGFIFVLLSAIINKTEK